MGSPLKNALIYFNWQNFRIKNHFLISKDYLHLEFGWISLGCGLSSLCLCDDMVAAATALTNNMAIKSWKVN